MSGSMEFVVRNGQPPQVSTSQGVNVRKKKLNRQIYFVSGFLSLFVLLSVGLFGYLYYLNGTWNSEIKTYDAKVNARLAELDKQMRKYEAEKGDLKNHEGKVNARFTELEKKIRAYETEIGEFKKRVIVLESRINGSSGNLTKLRSNKSIQKKLLLSKLPLMGEVARYKPISVQTMEENPAILDVDMTGLVDLAAIRADKNISRKVSNRELINMTSLWDKEELDKYRIKPTNKTTPAPYTHTGPRTRPTLATAKPDPEPTGKPKDAEYEDDDEETYVPRPGPGPGPNDYDDEEETVDEIPLIYTRNRRSAELANSANVNLIDTEAGELESRNRSSNPIDFSRTSSSSRSSNQTAQADKKIQCNSTRCEEPRKLPLLQKITTTKRSIQQTKKAQSVREISSPAGSEMEEESIDAIETRKTVVAAHFGADASKYSIHTHNHYDGNFHLRHPTGEYEDWKPSMWFDELNMNRHFALMNGEIKVHTPGLYFVYAQIFYSDRSDVNGYEVLLNRHAVLQCITSTISLRNVTSKSNTCYTGGVIKCDAGDKISVRTVDPDIRVMLEATRSFVGMFKIGDFQSVK